MTQYHYPYIRGVKHNQYFFWMGGGVKLNESCSYMKRNDVTLA